MQLTVSSNAIRSRPRWPAAPRTVGRLCASTTASFMRIPYTSALPPPQIIPPSADSFGGATTALVEFLLARPSPNQPAEVVWPQKTVLLTGAGISVASGLADYRGAKGTYTLNKTYRPIYFHEFTSNHEARKRYWARSFLGWTNLHKSVPNAAHYAIKELGERGWLSGVITQNVDSFHTVAHPSLHTIELHGYLRSVVCLTCRHEHPRAEFQRQLGALNPVWQAFLYEALASGALATEHPEERRQRGLRANPDGDVDLPDAPYSTFRYPPCPTCLAKPPPTVMKDGETVVGRVETDADGAWLPTSTVGVLKPNVVMFGESIPTSVKVAAEQAIDGAGKILVLGSSLATYSAWRLVKRAKEKGMPLAVLNLGGIRGEDVFFKGVSTSDGGRSGVRCSQSAENLLPRVVEELPS